MKRQWTLAKVQGDLSLDSLTNLIEKAMEHLAKHQDGLSLDGLKAQDGSVSHIALAKQQGAYSIEA